MTLASDSAAPAPPPQRSYLHPSAGRSRRAFSGVLWSGVHTLVPTLASALVFFVAARFLSPVEFGLVGFAASLVAVAVALAPGAFGEAIVQRQDIGEAHASTIFWLTAGSGLVLYLPFALGAPTIARLAGEPALATILPVIGLRLPFEMAAVVPNALIVRSMEFRLVALRTTLATVTSGVLCLALLWMGYGLWALVASQVTAAVVTCVAAFAVTRWRPRGGVNLGAAGELGRYTLFASGSRFLNQMSLDQVLVGYLGGAPVLGVYFFAKRLFTLLTGTIAGALTSVSHVLLSSLQSEAAKVRQAFLIATWASTAVAFPAFAGLALIAGELVPVAFGAQWQSAVVPVQAFCVVGILASIGAVQGALIASQGRADSWFWYQAVQQLSTLAVIWIWAGDMATMMVALAVKTVLFWPISVRMTTRLLDVRVRAYLAEFAAPAAATAAMAAAVLAVPAIAPHLSAGETAAAQIAAGVAVYPPCLLLLARRRIGHVRRLIAGKGPVAP